MHFQIKTMSHGKYSNRHFYTGHKIEKKIKRNAKHLHLNQVSNSIIHSSSIHNSKYIHQRFDQQKCPIVRFGHMMSFYFCTHYRIAE